MVQHLLETTGIDLQNGGGINDLQRFQDHFTEYRILFGGLDCEYIIFDGQVKSEKKGINLLYGDVNRYYHVTTNLRGQCSNGTSVKVVTKDVDLLLRTSVKRHAVTACPFRHAYLQMFESRAGRAIEPLEVNHVSSRTRLIN